MIIIVYDTARRIVITPPSMPATNCKGRTSERAGLTSIRLADKHELITRSIYLVPSIHLKRKNT